MAGQADDAHVEGEVLAAELGADAGLLGELEELGLELEVAEGAAALVAGGGQGVVVFRGRELHRLEVHFRGGAADDNGEVVGRAGGGAEVDHLLEHELLEAGGIEEGLGLLEEVGLVGGAAALGDEEEVVVVALAGVEVDLGGEVVPAVDLLVHGQRHGLGVAEVLLGVGLPDALGEVEGVVDAGPDLLALLGDDGGGAGVLAEGQQALRGDFGVAQHGEGDAAVVGRGLGVGEDGGDLLEVRGAEHEGAVLHRLVGEDLEGLGFDDQHVLVAELLDLHEVGGRVDFAVLGRVGPEGEHFLVFEGGSAHVE